MLTEETEQQTPASWESRDSIILLVVPEFPCNAINGGTQWRGMFLLLAGSASGWFCYPALHALWEA